MRGLPRILTVATIALFFAVGFFGLVLGSGLHRNLHPTRGDQCEPLTTDKDPKAVVLEPQNTWSNWGYLFAGTLILYRSRNLLGAAVGLNLAFEFLFSALYHSKLTDSMQFIDVGWIYVLLLSLIACAVQSVVNGLHDPARETEVPTFSNWRFLLALGIAAASIFLGILIRVIHPDSTITTLLLAGMMAVVIWFKYLWKLLSTFLSFVWPPELPNWRLADTIAVILAFVFGIPALVCRFSDGPDHILFNWCSRDEGTLQAHAVWHVTSAMLVLVTYDFLGHYFPEQGRIFASWRDD